MILHIFNKGIFFDQFIAKSYLLENNNPFYFIVIGDYELETTIGANRVLYVNKNKLPLRKIGNLFKIADQIFIHSMSKPFLFILWLSRNIKFLCKTTPIFWGADLYEFQIFLNESKGIKKVINQIRKKCFDNIYSKVKKVGCITPQDYNFFKNVYNSSAIYYPVIYSMDLLDKKIDFVKYENVGTVNICIGHSANPILKHLETYRKIKKYKNVHFVFPLAYGNENYIHDIEKSLKLVDNVSLQKEFLDSNEYINFCKNLDILVLNTDRQIALGNIFIFLFLGKLICVPENSNLSNFFNELDIEFIAYEKLLCQNGDFLDLSNFEIDRLKNRKNIEKYTSKQNFIKIWSSILKDNGEYNE